tara:strand:+ start:1028 stop:1621 length:594 start_codon:yes stop_codon:yes gene_type:complete
MKKIGAFGYIVIAFIFIIILKIYWESDMFQLKCVISEVDGKKYCVRERDKLMLAADMLAKTTQKMKKLVEYVKEEYPTRENCQRLGEKFNPTAVREILPTSKYTAYSENKGQKLAFCVTTTKEGNKLIDENTLTFVALHELAHIMTKSIGHKEEFWNNFKFLLQNAKKIGIYKPVDYKQQNVNYCGMTISDNPLFDL